MLKQKNNNVKYVNIFEGKFYFSDDKEKKVPYDELEGTVTNIEFKDEKYNASDIRKLYISVSDGENVLKFGVISDSIQGTALINFLCNSDLSKPLTFIPKFEVKMVDGIERKSRMIFLSQNEKPIKSKYTKESLPKVTKVILNKKEVADKTALIEFFEDLVNNELLPKLQDKTPLVQSKEEFPWEKETVQEDLPF